MSYILIDYSQKIEKLDGMLFKICNTVEFKELYRDSIPKGIRSYIDSRSTEFCFGRLEPLTKEDRTNIAWEKLIHLYLAFDNDYNVKGEIIKYVKRRIVSSPYFETIVKTSLAAYIDLLRNGGDYRWGSDALDYLIDNLSIDKLVDLLESEIKLRTYTYNRPRTNYSIVEFVDMKYDYEKLSRKFGIQIPPNGNISNLYSKGHALYTKYSKFIEYITTDAETWEMQQEFIRATMILG